MFHRVHAVLHNVFQQANKRFQLKLHSATLCFTLCNPVQLILHSASSEFILK